MSLTKRKYASDPTTPSEDGIVTTGAFFTRATLKKLGGADSVVTDPETTTTSATAETPVSNSGGTKVGDWVQALDLNKQWYKGVILAIRSGKVFVHYPGWEHIYNEWIPLDSRRLRLSIADNQETADGFDLQKAIQDSNANATSANGEQNPSTASNKHPRGRPTGSKNRRRVGHIKKRPRKLSKTQKAANQRAAQEKETASLERIPQAPSEPEAEAEAEAEDAEVVIAPEIPKELRIPKVRLLGNGEEIRKNPYARKSHSEGILTSNTNADGGTKEKSSASQADISSKDQSDSDIWHMVRGQYVTTGAFLTRRAIKCLAHNDSAGGIIQDYHGYYPGQLVEVLNANRKWYTGRVISYANKKFLVHYPNYSHAYNEWMAAGSKRMRKASESIQHINKSNGSAVKETEEEARKICAVLVDEYNSYVDDIESQRQEKEQQEEEKRKARIARQVALAKARKEDTPSSDKQSKGMEEHTPPTKPVEEETDDDDDMDEDVEPISVESGYVSVPQLLRVKDYVGIYHKGMRIAARDRNLLWWKAEIADIRTFRIRIHYTGFSKTWDEWMEMNTQRIMLTEGYTKKVNAAAESTGKRVPLPVSAKTSKGYEEQTQPNEVEVVVSDNPLIRSQDREVEVAVKRPVGRPRKYPKRSLLTSGMVSPSIPLSLRQAIKESLKDHQIQEQNRQTDNADMFQLPREHLTMRDYNMLLKVGDRVCIRGQDSKWQDSTIVNVKDGRIRVCYHGQPEEYNEWILVNSDRIGLLRETIEHDKRLEKLEWENNTALRKKQEKNRAKRKQQSVANLSSLARLAENLEYIVDQTECNNTDSVPTMPENRSAEDAATNSKGKSLLRQLHEDVPGIDDATPLLTRLLLSAYHANEAAFGDSEAWFVYCNQCNVVIRTFRYYCLECERPSEGYDYVSFDLCLMCFARQFPEEHQHPQTSFARAAVSDAESIVSFTADILKTYCTKEDADKDSSDNTVCNQLVDVFAGLVSAYEPDQFDHSYDPKTRDHIGWSQLAMGLHGTTTATTATTKSAVLNRLIGKTGRAHITTLIEDSDDNSNSGNDGGDDGDMAYNTSKRKTESGFPRCAFCGEDDPERGEYLGGFVGERPLVLETTHDDGAVQRRRFWAHEACSRYSPEVLAPDMDGEDNQKWYNVAVALRRARTIKCAACKKRGATIGCFNERCQKSYHVACTKMPLSFFERGCIFWCPRHWRMAAGEMAQSYGNDISSMPHPRCASCSHELTKDIMWMTCLECPQEPGLEFNICLTCYENKVTLENHPHKKRCFREHLAHAGGVTSSGQYIDKTTLERRERVRMGKKRTAICHYCRTRQSRRWRKGYGGVIMCESCFNIAHDLQSGENISSSARRIDLGVLHEQDLYTDSETEDAGEGGGDGDDNLGQIEIVALNPFGSSKLADPGTQVQLQIQKHQHSSQHPPPSPHHHGTLVEDYVQNTYFTRETCAASNRLLESTSVSQQPLGHLNSYGPTDSMLFTLIIDSTYYDIPGRAPRWGSHSGTDYHGTWLPQTVHRALLRYTKPGDRILSNFLGRGTDAIECFLLNRKCIGVDINPSAVSLSQRNCSFAIGPGMSVEFRPVIMQGDARVLCEDGWPGEVYFTEPESFDHILSHPPYKDCVLYSTNIEGDLSRFPGPEEFQQEMEKVAQTSWRLLKMGRYLTLGIGDNRAECFYIPVSYQLIRTYIDRGFELEELIVKRQRYCQAFGLGTYLCVHFDFLMFTHEFLATLRKVPLEKVDHMHLTDEQYEERPETLPELKSKARVEIKSRILREVPPSPIERKSVVMGSVWTFDAHQRHTFPQLCMSRMVERFGRDQSNWEHTDLVLHDESTSVDSNMADNGEGDDSAVESEATTIEFRDNGTRAGDYERNRQKQIRQNRAQLLHLGLVSELGEDSSDTAHYEKMIEMPPRDPIEQTPLALIVVPHIPNIHFAHRQVEPYRQALVQLTHDASHRLCPSGMLVLGVQDVRDENGKLWPLGMLVLEDVQAAVGDIRLRLKEFIVVVENGHARKRDDVVSREQFSDQEYELNNQHLACSHLPIVHAYYLVFMKLK